jgi:hypothetical protein
VNDSSKVLGTPIGGVSDTDGDGDGFRTGPDGEDNIPAPQKLIQKIVQHSGTKYLEMFNKQRQEQEEIHGDLSKAENATRALKKNFPNIRKIDIFKEGQETLSPLQIAHTVSLLHLSSGNKEVAETIHRLDDVKYADERAKKIPEGTSAMSLMGFIGYEVGMETPFGFEHALMFNKKITGFVGDGDFDGWGDAIARKMLDEGALREDVDTFWGMYITNHEWTHAEHNLAQMKKVGSDMNASPKEILAQALLRSGMVQEQIDDLFASQKKLQAELNAELDEVALENLVLRGIIKLKWRQVRALFEKASEDDLNENERRQISGNYPTTVSLYATRNFLELVAEKGSAARMGNPAGAINNPAWRKFNNWLYDGKIDQPNTAGMTRQQRRQLERAAGRKKSADDDSFFNFPIEEPTIENGVFTAILSRCSGFTHLKNSKKEKSLAKRTMRRNKFVGRTHVLDRSVQAEAKALQLRTKQYVHDYYEIMSNTTEEKVDSPYTNPALRERIKDRVMAGSQGGRPGQWSARKAQLVAQRYRSAGGGYKKGRGKTKKQRSLSRWSKEKWRTSDGKPALRGGKMRRYLPDKVWGKLTPSQRAATNRKKIEGDKRGRQFVPNTETAASTAAKFRKKS